MTRTLIAAGRLAAARPSLDAQIDEVLALISEPTVVRPPTLGCGAPLVYGGAIHRCDLEREHDGWHRGDGLRWRG